MKQKWTLQQVESLLKEHAGSGLNKKDFLKSRGVNPATFYYWQKRLQDDSPKVFTEIKSISYAQVELHIEGLGWLPLRSHDANALAQVVIALKSACDA